jgi:trk system potassium uptake protein TrkH
MIKSRNSKNRHIFKHLTLNSKIAIAASLSLIFGGGILFFIFEFNNPLTIGDLSLFDKIQVSLFQSVTTRTAGFASVPQENLTGASAIVSLILMFIGGSPVGTAGGVKTVTAVVLFCSAFATIQNKNTASVFRRTVSTGSIRKAVAVVAMFFVILLSSTVLLASVTDAAVIDILYETVSATATVGLSRNLTASLGFFGKIIIIITMYFGRVGPISLAVALGSGSETQNIISNPTEDIIIG